MPYHLQPSQPGPEKIRGHFNAFKGSRPSYHTEKMITVRGISRSPIEIDEMEPKLAELESILGAKVIDVKSESAQEFMESVDNHIRENIDVDNTPDSGGFEVMAKQLEQMGLHVEYKLFMMEHAGAFVAIWKDRSGFGPLYVEVTVTDLDV